MFGCTLNLISFSISKSMSRHTFILFALGVINFGRYNLGQQIVCPSIFSPGTFLCIHLKFFFLFMYTAPYL